MHFSPPVGDVTQDSLFLLIASLQRSSQMIPVLNCALEIGQRFIGKRSSKLGDVGGSRQRSLILFSGEEDETSAATSDCGTSATTISVGHALAGGSI
jgi:hypothetical protein